MAVNPEQRWQHWDRKFNTSRVIAVIDEKRQQMLERYRAAVTALCAVEEQVRQVLNAAGVQTIDYIWYLNYGRELFRLSRGRRVAGESLALAAEVLLNKWQQRGLDEAVLSTIRSQVLSIGEPET